jgi:tetratricopeptide (TPR) repeat protein
MSDSVPPLDSSDAAPPDASEANDQGNLYYDQKKYEEAVAAYSKAIELHPRYSWAYCNRAAVCRGTWAHVTIAAQFRHLTLQMC